jgi:hypothetical protein
LLLFVAHLVLLLLVDCLELLLIALHCCCSPCVVIVHSSLCIVVVHSNIHFTFPCVVIVRSSPCVVVCLLVEMLYSPPLFLPCANSNA